MGARPANAAAVAEAGAKEEEDEVEEVASDEEYGNNYDNDDRRRQQPDVDFIRDDSGGGDRHGVVDDWADNRGAGGGGERGGWDEASGGAAGSGGGGVADYDDQLLGEEGCGDAASRGVESEAHQPSFGGGIEGNASVETAGAATTNSGLAADRHPLRPAPEDARQREGSGNRLDGSAGGGVGEAAEGAAVSPATARLRRSSPDDPAAPTAAAAAETPRGRQKHRAHGHEHQQPKQPQQHQHHQHQPHNEPSKEPSPPPRTPVRPPRAVFSASSFGRGGAPSSSATAASSAATGGKWRPSFGSGGGGRPSPAGAMHAPWTAFSTPSRDRDGAVVPPSGSMGTGTMGSASSRRRRGGGAGNGPLGRLLQQACTCFFFLWPLSRFPRFMSAFAFVRCAHTVKVLPFFFSSAADLPPPRPSMHCFLAKTHLSLPVPRIPCPPHHSGHTTNTTGYYM